MGASQLLRGVAVGVHGHDVDVGVAEQLVDDLKEEAERLSWPDWCAATLV